MQPRNLPRAGGPPVQQQPRLSVPTSKLMILGLAIEVTEEELEQCFEQFGPLVPRSVHIAVTSGHPPVPKGYGFVQYVRSADAAHALVAMQGFEMYGKQLRVVVPKQASTPPGHATSTSGEVGVAAGLTPPGAHRSMSTPGGELLGPKLYQPGPPKMKTPSVPLPASFSNTASLPIHPLPPPMFAPSSVTRMPPRVVGEGGWSTAPPSQLSASGGARPTPPAPIGEPESPDPARQGPIFTPGPPLVDR